MQAFGAALLVTVVLVIVFLVIGLPLIKEIEQSRIQRLLIAERMSQHRQQTTLILAGTIAFVLMSLVFGYFHMQERERNREHHRWMLEHRPEQAQLPPPTVVVIGGDRPNRGTVLELASRVMDVSTRPTVIDIDEWEEKS